jgi:hypothetical protein
MRQPSGLAGDDARSAAVSINERNEERAVAGATSQRGEGQAVCEHAGDEVRAGADCERADCGAAGALRRVGRAGAGLRGQYAGAKKVDDSWTKQERDGVPVGRELNHPVVGVSWEDAQGFCQWLTEKESAEGKLPKGWKYRLPSDEEWSWAVGLPPELGATPAEKSGKNSVDFPWGKDWPPTKKVGNYADETFHAKVSKGRERQSERISLGSRDTTMATRRPRRWGASRPMRMAFTTWAATCGSGARTGSTRMAQNGACAAGRGDKNPRGLHTGFADGVEEARKSKKAECVSNLTPVFHTTANLRLREADSE